MDSNEIREFIVYFDNIVAFEIILSSEDKALTNFENINSKGVNLSVHDLIKNYFYILISESEASKREVLEKRTKDLFDTKIYKNINNDKQTFWKILVSIIKEDKQPIGEDKIIYNEFKEASKEKFNLNLEKTNLNLFTNGIENLLNLIEKNYNIYEDLMKYNKKDIYLFKERWEKSLSAMVSKTFLSFCPILFKLYNDYKENRFDKEELNQTIININIYKLRRKLSYDGIKDLKNMSIKFVKYLNNNNLALNSNNFIDYINNVINLNRYNRNIDDLDFAKNLKSFDLYNGDTVLEILVELEWLLSKNEGFMAVSNKKIQVEHILTQEIGIDSEGMKNKIGWEQIEKNDHSENKNTLGNLTLTFDNQELSNKPFKDKKEIYLESNLRINSYFIQLDFWDIDSIKKRSKDLISDIKNIWKFY